MNNLNKKLRFLPVIGITLTLVGYLYLTFQTFSLNEHKDELKSEIEELELIKTRLINETKFQDTFIHRQDEIISQSSDTQTIIKGIALKREFSEPVSDHFVFTDKKTQDIEQAKMYELQGFNFLIKKEIDSAISSFRKSENSYNGFHMVYEIAVYLKKNRNKLSDNDPKQWSEIYQTILKEYSWKMPDEIKVKLKRAEK